MLVLRPVEVKASPVAVAIGAVSIFVALFSILGWTLELGEDISGADLSYLANDISDGFSSFYHWLCGDYVAYYYAKNGELTQDMIDQGWYVDEVGNLLNNSYTVENPTDIVTGIDWETFEETGDITFAMQVAHYESLWQDVQNWMHGGYYRYLNQLVQSVSAEPTIAELRDSPMNLYLGSVGYTTITGGGSPQTTSIYTFKSDKAKVEFDCWAPHYTNLDRGNYIKFSVYNSSPQHSSWFPCFIMYFNSVSDNGYSLFDLQHNKALTEDICKGEWGVSLPYKVTDSDGNVNTYMYLFSYLADVVIKSSYIIYHTSDSSKKYNSSTFFECIEKFDKDLENYAYSSSSDNDDVVRSSATANQYAGTLNTGDDDDTYTPVTAPGQAGTIPVTGTGSLVNPVTGVNGSDYANGTSVPLTGTVTGSASVTQTDTGVKSEVNSVVSSATVDYPDGFDRWEPSIKLLTKFPFCIPYDLYSCFAILYKDPKELYFEIPFKISSLSLDEKVVIDLRKFDSLVIIVRYLSLIGFVIFLTLKTRDLIKG